ncbi:MAG: tetratricopeptide repeat protein, partial [Chloroflexi bacterium]|nr:tetratricopeptide repeat protein [Chloroflexota bacterium]
LLARRLNRIPDTYQPALRLCAVAGRQVDPALLAHLLEDAAALPPFFLACTDAALFDVADGSLRFSHDKLRQAILDDIQKVDRPDLHRQVAEGIEAIYPEDDAYAEVLLRHWTAAGVPDKQIHYAQRAAEQAYRAAEYSRALAALQGAQAVLPAEADDGRILVRMADIYERQAEYDQAIALYDRVLALPKDTYHADALLGKGQVLDAWGDYGAAAQMTQQAQTIFEAHSDPVGAARCLRRLGNLANMTGHFDEAERLMQEALTRLRALGNQPDTGDTLIGLGVTAIKQGRAAEAIATYQEAAAIFEQLGDRYGLWRVANNLGTAYVSQGDLEQAQRYLEQAVEEARAIGIRRQQLATSSNLGVLYAMSGKMDEAERIFTETLEIARRLGALQEISQNLSNLAHLSALKEDYPAARDHYEEVAAIREETGDMPLLTDVLAGLAPIYQRLGRPDKASGALRRTIDLAKAHQVRPLIVKIIGAAAEIAYLRSDAAHAARWAGAVLSSDKAEHQIKEEVGRFTPQLKAALGEAGYQAALAAGEAMTADEAVADIERVLLVD